MAFKPLYQYEDITIITLNNLFTHHLIGENIFFVLVHLRDVVPLNIHLRLHSSVKDILIIKMCYYRKLLINIKNQGNPGTKEYLICNYNLYILEFVVSQRLHAFKRLIHNIIELPRCHLSKTIILFHFRWFHYFCDIMHIKLCLF